MKKFQIATAMLCMTQYANVADATQLVVEVPQQEEPFVTYLLAQDVDITMLTPDAYKDMTGIHPNDVRQNPYEVWIQVKNEETLKGTNNLSRIALVSEVAIKELERQIYQAQGAPEEKRAVIQQVSKFARIPIFHELSSIMGTAQTLETVRAITGSTELIIPIHFPDIPDTKDWVKYSTDGGHTWHTKAPNSDCGQYGLVLIPQGGCPVIGKHEEPLPPDAKYTVYVISWRVFGPTECVSLHKICQNGDVQQGDTTALVRDLSNEVRSIKEDFLIKLARHAEEPEES